MMFHNNNPPLFNYKAKLFCYLLLCILIIAFHFLIIKKAFLIIHNHHILNFISIFYNPLLIEKILFY